METENTLFNRRYFGKPFMFNGTLKTGESMLPLYSTQIPTLDENFEKFN